jgi:hypothetical protein
MLTRRGRFCSTLWAGRVNTSRPALGLFLELLSDLHKAAEKGTFVYLSAEHNRWLSEAVNRMRGAC